MKQLTYNKSGIPVMIIIIISVLSSVLSSCKKLIEVKPPITDLSAANVYDEDKTAIAAVTEIYLRLGQTPLHDGSLTGLSFYTGLSADELFPAYDITTINLQYYRNELTSVGDNRGHFWNRLYRIVFDANAAIEGLQAASSISEFVKKQLMGEAYFMRAFTYFNLFNLYGPVPIATNTDYKKNALLPRSSRDSVYALIVDDLKKSRDLLSETYAGSNMKSSADEERVRPNKSAATAMLARVYLYMGDYANAEDAATAVIDNTTLYGLPALTDVFLKNSAEAIWQLQPVFNAEANTREGAFFILPAGGPDIDHPVYLLQDFIDHFQPGDARKQEWTASMLYQGNTIYYPFKYKLGMQNPELKEYTMVLRLAEQYLIRAEARAYQQNFAEAVQDINKIRKRARGPLPGDLPDLDGSLPAEEIFTAIALERQYELFTEWGHRWFDLKRTGKATEILAPLKGGTWQDTDELYPIPQEEINRNPSLKGNQNQGY